MDDKSTHSHSHTFALTQSDAHKYTSLSISARKGNMVAHISERSSGERKMLEYKNNLIIKKHRIFDDDEINGQ